MDTINFKSQLLETKKAVALQSAMVSSLLSRYEEIFRCGIATSDLSCENLSISYLDALKQSRQLKLDYDRIELQLKVIDDGCK